MINILFVCMGNICRSPSAEAVMNALIKLNGLSNKIKCDSAGTIAYHEGEMADSRMMMHAFKRGIELNSTARKIKNTDLELFNYIITMDSENYLDVSAMRDAKKYTDKIYMITDFCINHKADEVPDPYFGGPEGFEHVLDLLEDSCKGLLKHILNENPDIG